MTRIGLVQSGQSVTLAYWTNVSTGKEEGPIGALSAHLLRRRGDYVKREVVAVKILQQIGQDRDVFLEADALAGFNEMFFADAAQVGIVEQEIGQFPALLDEVNAGEAFDALA